MNGKTFSLVPALDSADLDAAERLVEALGQDPFIYGFKLGFSLGLGHGLGRVSEVLRRHTEKPLIYDHQKAGTDIPDTGELFADTLARCRMDEAILFPQAGPRTLRAWAEALAAREIRVIVGGVMTHQGYLLSEGGFIEDAAIFRVYTEALAAGVAGFVVPLTRPEITRQIVERCGLGDGHLFYSPGFGSQGGDPEAFEFLKNHRLIVGRSLLAAPDPVAYTRKVEAELAV